MNCTEFENALPELLYDELDDQAATRAREHLSSCSQCSAQHAELSSVVQSLDRWTDPAGETRSEKATWVAGELDRAGAQRIDRRLLAWRPMLTGAAAAVVAFCFLTWTGASTGVGSDGFFVDFGREPQPASRLTDRPVRAGQFLLLLFGNDADPQTRKLREGRNLVREYSEWAHELQQKELLVAAEKLSDLPGRTLGPSAQESDVTGVPVELEAGQLEGFFEIAADDLDEATAIARSCPHLKYGGRIVIRRIEDTTAAP